jgi:predicted phage-related endonuclease
MIKQADMKQLAELRTSIKALEAEERVVEHRMLQALRSNEPQQAGFYRVMMSTFKANRVKWREIVEELKGEAFADEQLKKRGTPVRFTRVIFTRESEEEPTNGRKKK